MWLIAANIRLFLIFAIFTRNIVFVDKILLESIKISVSVIKYFVMTNTFY